MEDAKHGDSGKDNLAYVHPTDAEGVHESEYATTPVDIDAKDFQVHRQKIEHEKQTHKSASRKGER